MVAAMASATVPVREYTVPGTGVGSVVHTTVKNYNSYNVNNNSSNNVDSSSNCGNRITTIHF